MTGGTIIASPPWYLTNGTARIITTPTVTTTSSNIIDPWIAWNDSITSATTSAIWTTWVRFRGQLERVDRIEAVRLADLTSEQQAAAQAEGRRIAQQMQAERAAAQLVKSAARDKARALLLAQLTDLQRIDLASNGYFEIETIQPSGERRRYRIRRGRSCNIERIDAQGRRLFTLCAHPAIDCPDEDTMLTQKLWIERNEEQFLRLANVS